MSENFKIAHPDITYQCYFEPKIHDHVLYYQLCDLNRFLLLPIAISGILCNACALVFLYRPPKITSGVFVYLKALLILDHLMLIATLAKEMVPQICDTQYDPSHTFFGVCHMHRRLMKYSMPKIESLISTMHVWTIATLSAHRYWKISRPVISRLRDTVSLAHTVVLLMLSIVFIYHLPSFLVELEIRTRPQFLITHRRAATKVMNWYRFTYHSILDPLLINITPFIIMCYFSIMTLSEIYRSRYNTYQNLNYSSSHRQSSSSSSHPLAGCFPKKAEILRQKQELRATFLIVVIILLYLCFHSLKLYTMGRKWRLMVEKSCPTRNDYYQSHLSDVLSMISASVNAFVFIAFTNHLKTYIQLLLRKTSRTLSSSSDPPISPKTITSIESYNHFSI